LNRQEEHIIFNGTTEETMDQNRSQVSQ